MIVCLRDATKSARNAATMNHIQAGLVGESPGPPPAGTALGNPPEGSLPPVITGAGCVGVTSIEGEVMVVGVGDVVMGAGDVVIGAGDVVMGAGDVVIGAGDVVIGAGDVVIVVGVGLPVVSVGVAVAEDSVAVGVAVAVAVDVAVAVTVSVGVGDGFTTLQPAFQMAWPSASQLSPAKLTPDFESSKGGMMSSGSFPWPLRN